MIFFVLIQGVEIKMAYRFYKKGRELGLESKDPIKCNDRSIVREVLVFTMEGADVFYKKFKSFYEENSLEIDSLLMPKNFLNGREDLVEKIKEMTGAKLYISKKDK